MVGVVNVDSSAFALMTLCMCERMRVDGVCVARRTVCCVCDTNVHVCA